MWDLSLTLTLSPQAGREDVPGDGPREKGPGRPDEGPARPMVTDDRAEARDLEDDVNDL